MSKALILFLALGGIAACSRPANPAQPICKSSQTPSSDNCRIDPAAGATPIPSPIKCNNGQTVASKDLCPESRPEADAQAAETERCRNNPTAQGCPGDNASPCNQTGMASGGVNNSCVPLVRGPCVQGNQIDGLTDYCSPVGYQCSLLDTTRVNCTRTQQTQGQTNQITPLGSILNSIAESIDPCLPGTNNSVTSLCNARIPERDNSGRLIFSNTDQLDAAHGDKYLLLAVNKNAQGAYSLYLDARDRDVSNIRVRYLKNTAFDGLKGPSIKAEILWEVRGRQCRGRETVFALANYLKSKPLNAICEGATR